MTAHASEGHAAIPGSLKRGADARHDARGRRRVRRGLARRVPASERSRPHAATGRVRPRGRGDLGADRLGAPPARVGAQGVGASPQLERHDHALVERVADQAGTVDDDVDDEEAATAHREPDRRRDGRADERDDRDGAAPASGVATAPIDHVPDRDPSTGHHDDDHHDDDRAATAPSTASATADVRDAARDLRRGAVSSRS